MKYGFIGTGVMGGAIARALRKQVDGREILLADVLPEKAKALALELDCQTGSNEEAAACDFIVLGVKPQMLLEVLLPLRGILQKRSTPFVIVSMVAAIDIASILKMIDREAPVIRIMPNTPVAIGQGMILYTLYNVSDTIRDTFLNDMKASGVMDEIPEKLIDAASCVSGCGPAWVFQMIEALSDGGVACGLPRKKALLYAAQMVKGSADLLLQSGKHPGELKDAVCSPGGTTIQGVRVLEEKGFRGAITDAVIAAHQKTINLGK